MKTFVKSTVTMAAQLCESTVSYRIVYIQGVNYISIKLLQKDAIRYLYNASSECSLLNHCLAHTEEHAMPGPLVFGWGVGPSKGVLSR